MIISRKKDGDMKLKKNIDFFLKKQNLDHFTLIRGGQSHGNNLEIIRKDRYKKFFKNTDALITDNRNVLLCVLVADCLPISFKSKNVCGIIHAGWRGIASGIIEKTITRAKKFEKITELEFTIGPGISVCHFQIKEDLIEKFSDLRGIKKINNYVEKKEKEVYLDIKKIAKDQITYYGGKKINISSICTFCSSDYFSFRENETSRRMIALIKL